LWQKLIWLVGVVFIVVLAAYTEPTRMVVNVKRNWLSTLNARQKKLDAKVAKF